MLPSTYATHTHTHTRERVADSWPPGASSVQALQKKRTHLDRPDLPCPKDKFDAASLKKGQSTGVKCKAAMMA